MRQTAFSLLTTRLKRQLRWRAVDLYNASVCTQRGRWTAAGQWLSSRLL